MKKIFYSLSFILLLQSPLSWAGSNHEIEEKNVDNSKQSSPTTETAPASSSKHGWFSKMKQEFKQAGGEIQQFAEKVEEKVYKKGSDGSETPPSAHDNKLDQVGD